MVGKVGSNYAYSVNRSASPDIKHDKLKKSKTIFKAGFAERVFKPILSSKAKVRKGVRNAVTKEMRNRRVQNFKEKCIVIDSIMEEMRDCTVVRNDGLECRFDHPDNFYEDLLCCLNDLQIRKHKVTEIIEQKSGDDVKTQRKVTDLVDNKRLEYEIKQDAKSLIENAIETAKTSKELNFLAGFLEYQCQSSPRVLTANAEVKVRKKLNKAIQAKLNSELKQELKGLEYSYLEHIAEIYLLVAACKKQDIKISSGKADEITKYLLKGLELNNDQLTTCMRSVDEKLVELVPDWYEYTLDTMEYLLKPIINLPELNKYQKAEYSATLRRLTRNIMNDNSKYSSSSIDNRGVTSTRV